MHRHRPGRAQTTATLEDFLPETDMTDIPAPLDALNEAFHEQYDQAREEAEREVPVLVVLADELVVFRRGRREAFQVTPPVFHVIKSIAHAPPGLYTLLARLDSEASDASAAALDTFEERLASARSAVTKSAGELGDVKSELDAILEACSTLVTLAGSTGGATKAARDAFAAEMGPPLDNAIRAATRLQLRALDVRVEAIIGAFDAREKNTFQVVVTGDHQARVRSLGMQYFQKRLGETSSTPDHRVTYGEGVTDEEGALALVATRRLDEGIAKAFFGDAKRLQRDVLGDAVRDLLEEMDLGHE